MNANERVISAAEFLAILTIFLQGFLLGFVAHSVTPHAKAIIHEWSEP